MWRLRFPTSLISHPGISKGLRTRCCRLQHKSMSFSARSFAPIDDSHTPKKLDVLAGSRMRSLSPTELDDWTIPKSRDEPESRILILYTGGTIGMKSVEGIYSPAAGYLPRLLHDVPMLNDKAFVSLRFGDLSVLPYALPPIRGHKRRIVYRILEYNPLLDSCDMTFDDWIRVAEDIHKAYDNYDGFVVLHGTDTLAYTASALSFMMQNLGKPVVVTGSQIPVAEVRSDGMDNLVGALISAGHLTIPEVCVYFNNKLMRGNRTVKVDNADLDAFWSPNMPPLAKMAIKIRMNQQSVLPRPVEGTFSVQRNLCREVGVLRIFPSMSLSTVKAAVQSPIKGVVLQTLGSGNIPSKRTDILKVLERAVDNGCLIVNCSQCLRGRVDASYATGKILEDIGVIPGADMTPEAAMVKLCYVLGREDWDLEKKREMMETNLRGELTEPKNKESKRRLRRPSMKEMRLLREAMLPVLVAGNIQNKEEISRILDRFGGRTPKI